MTYWNERTPREQALIAVMLGLILLFCLWQFVWSPISASKVRAEQALETAQRDYTIIEAALPRLASLNAVSEGAKVFERSALIRVAGSTNIAISRIQPETDGSIKIWFEGVTTQRLYTFLGQLTSDYRVHIDRVNINRRDGGVVSAQITFIAGP